MSLTVFAGTSQMVALDLWAHPLPFFALAASVFVANLRYFVMGAALQPHLPRLRWYVQPARVARHRRPELGRQHRRVPARPRRSRQVSGRRLRHGAELDRLDPARALAAGGVLSDPTAARRLGLDFVGIAVFVVVAAILFRGKRDVASWSVAIAAAFAAKWLVAGNWYIVVGGLAGGLFGAWQDTRRTNDRKS